jgi:hypothetical protein
MKCDICGQQKESVRVRKVMTVGLKSGTVRSKFCDECAATVTKWYEKDNNRQRLMVYESIANHFRHRTYKIRSSIFFQKTQRNHCFRPVNIPNDEKTLYWEEITWQTAGATLASSSLPGVISSSTRVSDSRAH